MKNPKRDKNAPITDRAEYERLLKQMNRRRAIVFGVAIVIAVFLFLVMMTSGRILSIFGVKNTFGVMNIFYGAFYVLVGIAIVIALVFVISFFAKVIIDFFKGLKK